MAKEYDSIPDRLAQFAMSQKLFFIASAFGDDDINLSPKGIAPLVVIDKGNVAFADYYGSGNQTAKHLAAGGKATLVFMSFDAKPLIVRFFCKGKVLSSDMDEFVKISKDHFANLDSSQFRQIFLFDVYRVQQSCGFGVPEMQYVGDRSDNKYFSELLGPEPEGGW
jgi:hypothetical protein